MSINDAIKRALSKNPFVRSVLVLGGGTAGSQAVSILLAPLLTRLYSAEAFGILAVFMAILSVISVISSLRYELAIPIAEDEEEAVYVSVLAFYVALVTSFSVFLMVALLRNPLSRLIEIDAFKNYLWLLPLSLLLLSIYQISSYWAIRIKAFHTIAGTKLQQVVGSTAIKLGGSAFGPWALIFGDVVSQCIGIKSLCTLAVENRWHIFKSVQAKDIKRVAYRHRKFPLFATWGGLLNVTGAQLPPVLFAAFFSPTAAGLYALANRVSSLPMILVGQAIGNVFLSNAANARRDGEISVLVAQVHENLSRIVMPIALLLAITGPDVFAWTFGPEWREAGVFVSLMTPMLYFQFILSPISSIFNVLEKQEQGMLLQGFMVAMRSMALLLGAKAGNLQLAVILFSVVSAFSYFIFLVQIMLVSKNNLFDCIIEPLIKNLVIGLSIISPALIAQIFDFSFSYMAFSLATTICLICARYFFLFRKIIFNFT